MPNYTVYVVQEFVGCGYTIGHIATQRRIAQWKNLKAFTEEQQATKHMESLQKENSHCKYTIEEVPFNVPSHDESNPH